MRDRLWPWRPAPGCVKCFAACGMEFRWLGRRVSGGQGEAGLGLEPSPTRSVRAGFLKWYFWSALEPSLRYDYP
jgi:hypothetical protein